MSFRERIYRLKSAFRYFQLKKNTDKLSHGEIKTVCILLINVGIGDVLMATSFIRALNEKNISVDVITKKHTSGVLEGNTDIRNVFFYDKKMAPEQRDYDLVVDPFSHCHWSMTYHSLTLLTKLNYKYLSGFDVKYPKKYHHNFVPEDKAIHLTVYYQWVIEQYTGAPGRLPRNYILQFSSAVLHDAKIMMDLLPKNTTTVAFCPFASTDERSFSVEQVNTLITLFAKETAISIVFLMQEDKRSFLSLADNCFYFKTEDFVSSAAILGMCDLVVSVDTSFVHVANSHDKPALVFYSSVYNDGYNTDHLCGPNYDKAIQRIEKTGIRHRDSGQIYHEVMAFIHTQE